MTRENLKKKANARQIQDNILSEPFEYMFQDRKMLARKTYPVDSYSTKQLTCEDQIILAIDKIMFTDFKAAITPAQNNSGYDGIYMYKSSFSLNDGDKKGFLVLAHQVDKRTECAFVSQDDNVIVLSSDVVRKEHISYRFSYYDGGSVSGDPRIPSMSVVMGVKANRTDLDWYYDIYTYQDSDNQPRNLKTKQCYESMQGDLLSAITSIGIVPSAFDYEKFL